MRRNNLSITHVNNSVSLFLDSLPNLALNQIVLGSSSSYHKYGNVVDGKPYTYSFTGFATSNWLQIDLQVISEIFLVRIVRHVTTSTNSHMKYITIRIGNGDKHANAKCVENKNQETTSMYDYYCDQGPMIGKYVTIIIEGKANTYFALVEVEVYGNNIE